jgi:hypothetical protein
MFTDARIGTAFDSMMRGIDPPAVPQLDIARRISQPQAPIATRAMSRAPRFAIAAAVVVAASAAALPRVAPGFTQSLEARIEAVLHWTPPPSPPAALLEAMKSQTGSLAAAQSRVPFKIVPPAGLPSDVVSEKIVTTPTGVYTKANGTWTLGSAAVTFIFRRADGRSFSVQADRYDPQGRATPKYMWEDDGTAADGHERLVKHEHFAWRNGDQVMAADEDGSVSAREIASIQSAMNGVMLPRTDSRTRLNEGGKAKMYRLPAP